MSAVDLLIAMAAGVAFVIVPFLILAGLSVFGLAIERLWRSFGDTYHRLAPHAHSM